VSARCWWPGLAALGGLVALHAAASALASTYFQLVVLGVALLVGLGGTAVAAVVAQRRPAARAVAVGLVWATPVCATITSVVLLRS
jgi:hypothetical protein